MRRDGRWTRLRLGLGLAMAALVCAVAAPTAGAYPTWPGGVITYHVVTPSLRWSVHMAAAEWNRSGAHVRLVERPAGKTPLSVRAMRGGGCIGAVGFAPLGALPPGWHDTISLQARCDRFLLIEIAVHEFGHVLGLDHDTRHCSVMSPTTGGGCKDVLYPWEYRCHPIERVDVRRVVALYGGRVPRGPRPAPCLSKPTPTSVLAVRAETNPAGTLASTRITWRNPASRALRRVVVVRNQGTTCANYPATGSALIPGGIMPRGGELVADIDVRGAAGAPGEAFDTAPVAKGRWCYAVFAMGPEGRYARARTIKIVHPGRDLSAARISLAATVAPAAGVRVRLSWTTPAAPAYEGVGVERASGACPADPAQFSGTRVADVAATPGPAVADDADAQTPGGTWCYGVRFREAGFQMQPALVLLQVDGVPEPPNLPPVARLRAFPTEGSMTDGSNEIFLSDDSTDDDGRVVAWQWSLGDGTSSADASFSHSYGAPGTYVVTLVVTDDRGATASATQTITILP